MENLRRAVNQIAYTPPSRRLRTLSVVQLSLIPLLSLASSAYSLALSLRHRLYRLNILTKHRLPVPVISVGNVTWGGNGKTPMVEFLARLLTGFGISPLILTRGYGGADESRMLERHLHGTYAKIGVGADRSAIAASFLEKYGYINSHGNCLSKRLLSNNEKMKIISNSNKIGAVILDDGMQVQENDITALELMVQRVKESVQIFLTEMAPLHFFKYGDMSSKIPLKAAEKMTLLCVSGIGFAGAFIQRIKKFGPRHVDHLDFSDHHLFRIKDIDTVRARLRTLESKFAATPIVVVTEKDYDRAPEILQHLEPYEVLILCCRLQILVWKGRTEDSFKKIIMQHLWQD